MEWIDGGSKVRGAKKDARKYVTTPPTVLKTFPNFSGVLARGGKSKGRLGKRNRPEKGPTATEWHKAVCNIVDKYANDEYDKSIEEAASCFNIPEDAAVKRQRAGGKYWARKRNNPTVQFPVHMANDLRGWYNEQNPHCTADEAAERLQLQHRGSLYVKHVMTGGKIKTFFGGLKAKKVNGQVPVLTAVASATGYKQWETLSDLREEVKRRIEEGTMVKPLRQPSNKPGWAQLLELNDMQIDNALSEDTEEACHADGDDAEDIEDVLDDENGEDVEMASDDEEGCHAEAVMVYEELGDDGS